MIKMKDQTPAIVLCLFLLACEGSPDSASRSETGAAETARSAASDKGSLKGACDVFPLAIARKILGDGAERGQGTQPDMYDAQLKVRVSTCAYQADDPNSLGILVASLNLRTAGSEAQRKSNESLLEQGMKAFEGDDYEVEKLDGLGDKAYLISSSLGPSILMLANDHQYHLTVGAETREQAEQLARLVLEDL